MLALALAAASLVALGAAVGCWIAQRQRPRPPAPTPIDLLSDAAHAAAKAHGADPRAPWSFTISFDGHDETRLALSSGQYLATPPRPSRLGLN